MPGQPRGLNALPVDDPRHGSVAGYNAGCDCRPCTNAKNTYSQRRERQIAYGRWQPYIDAEPARQHLRYLSRHGIGWQQAAKLADLPDATVSGLLYRRGGRGPAQRCRKTTLHKILAVRPSIDNVSDRTTVGAIATLRRLRSLVTLGYPMQWIGERLPTHPEHARRLIRHGQDVVTAAVARAARDLFNQLRDTPAPDTWVSRRTRTMAAKLGWKPPHGWDLPPQDWDGLDIDVPDTPDPDPDYVSDVGIELVLRRQARFTTLQPPERTALLAQLLDQNLTVGQICYRFGISSDSVTPYLPADTTRQAQRRAA